MHRRTASMRSIALVLLACDVAALPTLRGASIDQRPARETTFAPLPAPPTPTDERLLELEAANAELLARVAALEAQVQLAVDVIRVAVPGPPLFVPAPVAAESDANPISVGGGIAVNDLNSMGNEIRLLNWDFGPKRDKDGKIVLDKDGQPVRLDYSKYGAGVYAVLGSVGMVAQLINGGGDNWGGIVLTGAKCFVPLIGLLNPALGLGVGILLSLFTPNKNGAKAAALLELYNQIMDEVQDMIDQSLVEENLASASVAMVSTLWTWYQNPWYVTNAPDTNGTASESLTSADYYTWYMERSSDFDLNVRFVFSHDCLNSQLQPAFPPNAVCQGFSAVRCCSSRPDHVTALRSLPFHPGRRGT